MDALTMDLHVPLGRVMSPEGDGVIVRESSKITVIIGNKDGQLFIKSTYLEAP